MPIVLNKKLNACNVYVAICWLRAYLIVHMQPPPPKKKHSSKKKKIGEILNKL